MGDTGQMELPADEGRLRLHGVEINRSVYRLLAVPAQIEELLDLMLDKANAIEDVFEQSFFIQLCRKPRRSGRG